jgi:hypothetical protein
MNVGNGFSLCHSHLFDDLKMQMKLVWDSSIENSYLGAVYYIAVNEFVSLETDQKSLKSLWLQCSYEFRITWLWILAALRDKQDT